MAKKIVPIEAGEHLYVHQYGVDFPVDDAQMAYVRHQLRAAHILRSHLCMIEASRRDQFRAAEREDPTLPPVYEALLVARQVWIDARDVVRARRAQLRKREIEPELGEAMKARRRELREARALFETGRRKARRVPAIREKIALIEEQAVLAAKNAERGCGVYWGTKQFVRKAHDQSCKTTPVYTPTGGPRSPKVDPIESWDGSGGIRVQFVSPRSGAQLHEDEERVWWVDPVDPVALTSPSRSIRRRAAHTKMHMRVDTKMPASHRTIIGSLLEGKAVKMGEVTSENLIGLGLIERRNGAFQATQAAKILMAMQADGKDGVVTFPMVLHRLIPEAAALKLVDVIFRRHGSRYDVSAVVSMDAWRVPRPVIEKHNGVALNLGWRVLNDGGVRVGYWVGDDGAQGEFQVPADIVSELRFNRSLQSIRDERLDRIKVRLAEWIKQQQDLPAWLPQMAAKLTAWRSQPRLAKLFRFWREHRFENDSKGDDRLAAWRRQRTQERHAAVDRIQANPDLVEGLSARERFAAKHPDVPFDYETEDLDGFALLDAWHEKDCHLWDWESAVRRKSILHRREHYRMFAASLAQQYKCLTINATPIAEFREKPSDDEEGEAETPRKTIQMVAPGSLETILLQAFSVGKGHRFQVVDPESPECQLITQWCHVHEGAELFDKRPSIDHVCGTCGAKWDQDRNAAINLIRRWQRDRPHDGNAPDARRTIGKMERLKAEKKERERLAAADQQAAE